MSLFYRDMIYKVSVAAFIHMYSVVKLCFNLLKKKLCCCCLTYYSSSRSSNKRHETNIRSLVTSFIVIDSIFLYYHSLD